MENLGGKVTQLEISEVCGVSQGHLSNVVLGRQRTSEELLRLIVDYLQQIDPNHKYTVEEVRSTNAPITKDQSILKSKNLNFWVELLDCIAFTRDNFRCKNENE